MAVAVQSSASTAWAVGSSVVITKPSGLVVGDLLVALIASQSGISSITPPAGWTSIRATSAGANPFCESFYKIATSTETAASNFTFTPNVSCEITGGILRIDGHSIGTPVWTSNGDVQSNTATPSFANTITPAIASSLLIMFVAGETGTGTVSGYAVVTSNPTWTESFDITTTEGVDYIMAVATATRTQTTATGNSSISFTGSAGTDWSGQLIAIPPSKDFAVTETISLTETVRGNLAVTFTDTVTTSENIDSLIARLWTKVTRNIKTWTKRDR